MKTDTDTAVSVALLLSQRGLSLASIILGQILHASLLLNAQEDFGTLLLLLQLSLIALSSQGATLKQHLMSDRPLCMEPTQPLLYCLQPPHKRVQQYEAESVRPTVFSLLGLAVAFSFFLSASASRSLLLAKADTSKTGRFSFGCANAWPTIPLHLHLSSKEFFLVFEMMPFQELATYGLWPPTDLRIPRAQRCKARRGICTTHPMWLCHIRACLDSNILLESAICWEVQTPS